MKFNLRIDLKLKEKWGLWLAGIVVVIVTGVGGYFLVTTNWDSPETVVNKYFTDIQQKDYQKAYQLASTTQYHETIKQFTDRVNNYGKDMEIKPVEATVDKKAKTAVVKVSYAVTTDFGKYNGEGTFNLVWENRAWKITNP